MTWPCWKRNWQTNNRIKKVAAATFFEFALRHCGWRKRHPRPSLAVRKVSPRAKTLPSGSKAAGYDYSQRFWQSESCSAFAVAFLWEESFEKR